MRNSDLLSGCLVDSDADAALRNKQRRRKALTISLAIEAVLLAALLVWPLLNPSTMSARYAVDPIPPYAGGGHRAPQTALSGPHVTRDHWPSFLFHYPTVGERRRPTESGPTDDAPSIGGSHGDGTGSGDGPGDGTGIFGSSGNGPAPPRPPDPKPPVITKPVIVSEGAQEALLVRRIEPLYPNLARQIHLAGTVELRAVIAKDGTVIDLEVVSGNPMLARAAVDAVRQWHYRPTLLNNQPVEVQTFVTVKFVLQ
jgi:periplasmic protein TonB